MTLWPVIIFVLLLVLAILIGHHAATLAWEKKQREEEEIRTRVGFGILKILRKTEIRYIKDWIVMRFKNETGIDLAVDNQAIQRIKEAAEQARIKLFSTTKAAINLPYIVRTKAGQINIHYELTYSEFEKIKREAEEKKQREEEARRKEEEKRKREAEARRRQEEEERRRRDESRRRQQEEEQRRQKEQQRRRQQSSGTEEMSTKKAFKAFGLDFGTDMKTVSKEYRRLAKLYHPDAVSHKPKAEQKRCEEKMKQINIAYQAIEKWYSNTIS